MVECDACGVFQTNTGTAPLLEALRQLGVEEIEKFRRTIKGYPEVPHITRRAGREHLVFEPMNSEQLTKRQKKLRRRGTRTTIEVFFGEDRENREDTE